MLQIASIKFGLWDRLSSRQAKTKEVIANSDFKTCAVDNNTDVKAAERDILVSSKHVLDGRAGNLHD